MATKSTDPVTVLIVTGVGMAAAVAARTVPVLTEHFGVLTFHAGRPADDGRAGAGSAIERLADDALAVLDGAGADRAHVYGLSFGGMVAQELALRHPDRVGALVLGATSAGGSLRVAPDSDAQAFIARRSQMPPEEAVWGSVPYSYAVATRRRHASRIGQDIAVRLRAPVDPDDHRVQRAAALEHDAADRLQDLDLPTLVVHGEEDRLVPPANGVAVAGAIPGARMLLLPDAAHMYPTDDLDADARVASFLLEQSPSRRPPRASGNGRAARA